jgi:hypothetical protein
MNTLSTRQPRKDRLLREQRHDPCSSTNKPLQPVACPVCNAVFQDGRWHWQDSLPVDSRMEICQACQRIRDNFPAGIVTMSGDFIRKHRQEVVNLARRLEREERARHPLHRIISIEELTDKVIVATTDIHLPKRIGRAMQRAGKGRLDLHYNRDACFVRVNWTADEMAEKKNIHKKRRQL